MIPVKLTPELEQRAQFSGRRLRADSVAGGFRETRPFPDRVPRVDRHIRGARGEAAFHQWSGLWWNDGSHPGVEPDFQPDIQVRTSAWKSLFVHKPSEGDPPEWRFVAVWDNGPSLYLVGWCYGHEGQREEFWNAALPWPAYTVPADRLRPMSEFTIQGALL